MLSSSSSVSIVPPTKTMLTKAWDVDRFIVLGSVDKLVAVLFCPFFEHIEKGIRPVDTTSSRQGDGAARIQQQYIIESATMKNTLDRIAINVSRYCTVFYVDTTKVTEFDSMYELFADEPFALLFFYKNTHIKLDVGTGNNNKINFPIVDEDEMKRLIEATVLGAKAGHVVVNSRMEYSQYAGRGQ